MPDVNASPRGFMGLACASLTILAFNRRQRRVSLAQATATIAAGRTIGPIRSATAVIEIRISFSPSRHDHSSSLNPHSERGVMTSSVVSATPT